MHEKMKEYWIKVNLHKDGSPLWHGVVGELELQKKISELKSDGYSPKIDHKMSSL